jgi:hypothetical protein
MQCSGGTRRGQESAGSVAGLRSDILAVNTERASSRMLPVGCGPTVLNYSGAVSLKYRCVVFFFSPFGYHVNKGAVNYLTMPGISSSTLNSYVTLKLFETYRETDKQ